MFSINQKEDKLLHQMDINYYQTRFVKYSESTDELCFIKCDKTKNGILVHLKSHEVNKLDKVTVSMAPTS